MSSVMVFRVSSMCVVVARCDYVNGVGGVRGVVSLSSESKLLGRGTYNDVYTVN